MTIEIFTDALSLMLGSVRQEFRDGFDLHCEGETTTFTDAVGVDLDYTIASFYNLLDNSQPKAYPIMIHLCCPV